MDIKRQLNTVYKYFILMKLVNFLLVLIIVGFLFRTALAQSEYENLYPVADIQSPVVHKSEFADIYLSNEISFPEEINNKLGLVVWGGDYQFVLINNYDANLHSAHLTLGVAGSAIKGFNLAGDNTAKLYLINDAKIFGDKLLTNPDKLHQKAIKVMGEVVNQGDVSHLSPNHFALKPAPITDLQMQGLWFEGDYPYYYFPDDLGKSGRMRWSYGTKSSLLSFSQSKQLADGNARIRVYNDAGILLRLEDVTGNVYQYSDRASYQDGNYQYLTFDIRAVVDGVESDAVVHRVKRDLTELFTTNLVVLNSQIPANGVASFSFDVDMQESAVWVKRFTLSGTAAKKVIWEKVEVSVINSRNQSIPTNFVRGQQMIVIPGGAKRVDINLPIRGGVSGDVLEFAVAVNSGEKKVTAKVN